MKTTLFTFIFISLLIFSCEKNQEKSKFTSEQIKSETEKVNKFFDKVYDDYIDRHPMDQSYLGIKKDQDKWNDISDSKEVKENEIVKSNLQKLKKDINYDMLDEQGKLSYRLFEYNCNDAIEGFKWRYHSYIVNQMFGLHSDVPSFLINIHQISDTIDAAAYISRIHNVGPLFDQFVENIEVRAKKGILPPKFVFEKVLEDSKSVIQGSPFEEVKEQCSILEDFSSKVEKLKISTLQKNEFKKRAINALKNDFLPAYNKLIIYLTNLQGLTTTDDGVWKLPQGNDYYKYSLRHITTSDMTPEEIFDLGTKEVERIQGEMRKIMKEVNFKSNDLHEFFRYMREEKKFYYSNDSAGKKAYLARSKEIINQMKSKLDELFITKPKAELIVKAVEPFREKSVAGAFYQEAAPDGSRPGVYYANLHDMSGMPKYEMEALCYHEAIPGHHMQLSIAQELQGIPKFRKYGMYTAYVEGWGLYSEQVPKEIGGFYADPYSDFGRLAKELFRACRLVVDVGIHSKKWNREQAVKYLLDNTPNAEVDNRREIDRYIVWPGQATAYKVGMYKILELRKMTQDKLAKNYNIREFHEEVLKNGALPLGILEENVMGYVKRKSS